MLLETGLRDGFVYFAYVSDLKPGAAAVFQSWQRNGTTERQRSALSSLLWSLNDALSAALHSALLAAAREQTASCLPRTPFLPPPMRSRIAKHQSRTRHSSPLPCR